MHCGIPLFVSRQQSRHALALSGYARSSSTTSKSGWFARQSRDPYVKKARQDGYRSRAAYKLEELQKKFRFLKKGMVVLDLGAAPGGWTQVSVKYVIRRNDRSEGTSGGIPHGKVIAVDLLPMDPIPGADILYGNMQDPAIFMAIDRLILQTESAGAVKDKVDVVLSDMAHPFTGSRTADVAKVIGLCELALGVAERPGVLKARGTFVCKFLQGAGEEELRHELQSKFERVCYEKPQSSRKGSAEGYLLCFGYKRAM